MDFEDNTPDFDAALLSLNKQQPTLLGDHIRRLRALVVEAITNYIKGPDSSGYSTGWESMYDWEDSGYARFLMENELSVVENIILLMVITPHIITGFYDNIIKATFPAGGDLPELGGVRGSNHRGMLPTGETVQFILAGNDLQKRIEVQQLLTDGALIKKHILELEALREGEPVMSGRLIVSQLALNKILTGKDADIKFSADFPAKKISTAMTWDDLVLTSNVQQQINDIVLWVKHNETLFKDEVLGTKLKPGYRALFYGPSGTGKTLTATLLGNQLNKDVYRIDLSLVVSKYIGETEKNLEKVFSKAENRDWILFFDEADALFGKRTNVQSAHDRYANQEVSYLLQRIEDHKGLLILASNFKSNMDDAFLRRFHNVIHFAMPNAPERLMLWQKTLPASLSIEPAISLDEIAEKYELTGASILSVIHYSALRSLANNDQYIRKEDLLDGIRKEYRKEERTIS